MVNISDGEDLNVSLDDMEFVYIDSIEKEHVENEPVYDLEVAQIPNYNTQIGIGHNGGGKRKGSFAIYLEPWHADIMDFLDLRKNNGKEELRTRDLNLAIWTPDLFFQRVEADEDWTLMDPNKCPDLDTTYCEEFNALYKSYEEKGMGEKTVKARDVWNKVLESCIETGEPYILAKDACNNKSNQKNLGTIRSSNLCLSGDTYVDIKFSINETEQNKKITLSDVNDLFKDNKELYIKSYDIKNNKYVYDKILNSKMTNTNADVLKITFDNNTIICTPEHKIFTKNRGYVEAQYLLENDIIFISEVI